MEARPRDTDGDSSLFTLVISTSFLACFNLSQVWAPLVLKHRQGRTKVARDPFPASMQSLLAVYLHQSHSLNHHPPLCLLPGKIWKWGFTTQIDKTKEVKKTVWTGRTQWQRVLYYWERWEKGTKCSETGYKRKWKTTKWKPGSGSKRSRGK